MRKQEKWLYDRAENHLNQSGTIKYQIVEKCLGQIVEAATLLTHVFETGNKLLLCGNGGSAADCQHIAAEFVGTLTQDFRRPGLRAIALTTDTSFLTAYTNDYGFARVFSRQVETLGVPGDVLIGISTSGNSKNVILALKIAKKSKMSTIILTGSGGALVDMADIAITVPSNSTAHIQESHITIGHILCDLVERSLLQEGQDR